MAQLIRLGKPGSFDFNSRLYADDDLIVGAAAPFQLFRILFECIRGGAFGPDSDVAYMLEAGRVGGTRRGTTRTRARRTGSRRA